MSATQRSWAVSATKANRENYTTLGNFALYYFISIGYDIIPGRTDMASNAALGLTYLLAAASQA